MEADGETPWEACRREVAEECGLRTARATGRLACMDFRRPRPGKPGGIRYLFDCGAFSDADLAGIVVQPEEISEYRLAELSTALTLLRKPIRRRVRAAARGGARATSRTAAPCPVGGRRAGVGAVRPGPVGPGGRAGRPARPSRSGRLGHLGQVCGGIGVGAPGQRQRGGQLLAAHDRGDHLRRLGQPGRDRQACRFGLPAVEQAPQAGHVGVGRPPAFTSSTGAPA